MAHAGKALDGHDPAVIERAARRLAQGELVAFPTETVYGLGARADDDAAVARIFAAKGRPSDHPLIVHVCDAAAAAPFASRLPDVAQRLMAAFWPGPLTLIVPRAPSMGRAAAGGQDSIGLRCPSHPVAQALLRACQGLGVAGVAAPSANRFGRVSPTQAAHVLQEFGAAGDDSLMVLDGGDSQLGIESTIVDCSRDRLVLLRPGMLTAAAIEAMAGEPLQERDAQAPRASGTLESHYAPRASVRLMDAQTLRRELLAFDGQPRANQQAAPLSPDTPLALGHEGPTLAVYSRSALPVANLPFATFRAMPSSAGDTAHELFAVLRAFDDEGVQHIWVEDPPADPGWDGVRDRLRRAAC